MPDVVWYGDQFLAEIDKIVRRKMLAAIAHYKRILQGLFRSAKSGRFYKVSKKGALHHASATGEPPAILTARLAQGVAHELERIDQATYAAAIGTDAGTFSGKEGSYPKALEFGTVNMEARPAWRPALEQLKADAEEVMRKA